MYENMTISQETSAKALQDSLRDHSIEENQRFIDDFNRKLLFFNSALEIEGKQ